MDNDNEQQLIFSGRTIEEALKHAREKLDLDPFADLNYEIIDDSKKKKFLFFGGGGREKTNEVKILIKFGAKGVREGSDHSDNHNIRHAVADVWDDSEIDGNRKTGQPENRHRPSRRSEGQESGRGQGSRRPQRDRPHRDNRDSGRRPVTPLRGRPQQSYAPTRPQTPAQPVLPEVVERVGEELNILFKKMSLDITVAVEKSQKNESIIRIEAQGNDKEWIMTQSDDAIRGIEEIIGKMVKAKFGEDKSCKLYFVGRVMGQRNWGHRSRPPKIDENALKTQVNECIDKIKQSGQPEMIGPMNAYERRLVHTLVSQAGNFVTESVGSGPLKKVKISAQ